MRWLNLGWLLAVGIFKFRGLKIVMGEGQVMEALWAYVKAKGLQDAGQMAMIACDGPLAAALGGSRIKMASISQRISPHLHPPAPITLDYTVK